MRSFSFSVSSCCDFQIGELRAQLLVSEVFADVDALLNERAGRFELRDRGRDGGALSLLLHPLPIERRELGPIFVDLLGEELPLHSDKRWTCACRRLKLPSGFASLSAARNRAMSSCAAMRSLLICSCSAAVMVGSSSIRTSPALTLWPSRT